MLMPSIFGESLLDELMDDFAFPRAGRNYGNTSGLMRTDVKETAQGYELAIDLPGIRKEDVKARLQNGYLVVNAASNVSSDEKDTDGKFIRRERYYGSMSRSYYVGDSVKEEDIHAKFEDGILRLTVPKSAPQKVEEQKYISIEG
ncbi:MAG: Hsp20/alpha crystallin family protein [Lachnospiraceae bacterium]|nr:Hsp20/alpha crystallin family protein [Lachnospiraceae bacterium]